MFSKVLSADVFFFMIRDLENDLSYLVYLTDCLLAEVIREVCSDHT